MSEASEVTTKNFSTVLPEFEANLKNARFITIDTEFSCLTASQKLQTSLFDSGHQRYLKLRKTVEQTVPLQIGLSTFTLDRDTNSYQGHVYTFYVFPRTFSFIDRRFLCQSSSFQFLSSHNFDFNKFVNEGISYINRIQEEELLKYLKNAGYTLFDSSMTNMCDNVLEEKGEIIAKWFASAKLNDNLVFDDLKIHDNNLDLKFYLHKELRKRFKYIWTYEDAESFRICKITKEDYEELMKEISLEESFIAHVIGFTRIFRLLTSLRKPIIGHNLLLDLMVMIQNFEQPLPRSYEAFKKLTNSLFPTVYDTKCIAFDIKNLIPEKKMWKKNTLENLYHYFRDEYGQHLVPDSPFIETVPENVKQNFHSAGWDSFCTGYIFIRMAHVYAADKCQVKDKKFMSSELLQAVAHLKNMANVIRGHISYIKLDGDDPISRRPPWLIVKGINKPLNLNQLTSLLSNYGFIEVKAYSTKGDRAIVAVDNFGSARRILNHFKSHSDFKIQQYSFLKHSPVIGTVVWSGILMSGAFITWYGFSKLK